jgi:hypothetical protein
MLPPAPSPCDEIAPLPEIPGDDEAPGTPPTPNTCAPATAAQDASTGPTIQRTLAISDLLVIRFPITSPQPITER